MLAGKQIVSFWHCMDGSGALPSVVLMSIQSFLDAGFPYALYTYQNLTNVPRGCEVRDAREIVPYGEFFIHESGSVAPFSDYFRIHLLLRNHDCVWSDTDNVFIKDTYSGEILAIDQDSRIQNSILHFGHSAVGDSIRQCLAQFLRDPLALHSWDSRRMRRLKLKGIARTLRMRREGQDPRPFLDWTIAGSELYTSIFSHLGISAMACDYYTHFNPFHFSRQSDLYVKDISEIDQSAFDSVGVLVLSTDLLRREPWIVERYDRNSFIANLLAKHGIPPESLFPGRGGGSEGDCPVDG